MRTERLQKERKVQFRWTVFPLHPDTPDEGLELSQLFAGREVDLVAMQQRLDAVADRLGLPLTPRPRTFNSRAAQELGKFAEKLGRMEEYQQAVYRAYFGEGRNIALPAELLAIAERCGLPREESEAVLEEKRFAKAVEEDWKRCRLLGISGVPSFLCEGRLLVGFRPYHDFEEWLVSPG